MLLRSTLALFAAAAVAACGPASTPSDPTPDAAPDVAPDAAPDVAPDAAPDAAADVAIDARPMDAVAMDVACSGTAPSCVAGMAGGQCSDALTVARCDGGAWRCGAGEVFTSQCACIGRPLPGCTCARTGWVCPDAGADALTDARAADCAATVMCGVAPPGCSWWDQNLCAGNCGVLLCPDAGTDATAADVACSGTAPSCVAGTAGGQCSDALTVARCDGGAWRCGAGEVFTSQCACIGRPLPGCTCARTGWVCPDAGLADVPAECTGRPASCVSGTAGGACGDVVTAPTCVRGAWTCGEGQVFITQCACTGRPPGARCTCTPSGWSCPDAGLADAAGDGGAAGTLCAGNADCAAGLLCCYPCGIPGCMNRCMAPMGGRCPLIP